MGHWYYRACIKFTQHKGKKYPFYCVVEYHPRTPVYRKCGKKILRYIPIWSDQPENPQGMTKKELILCLEMMLVDVKRYRTLIEKKPYKERGNL